MRTENNRIQILKIERNEKYRIENNFLNDNKNINNVDS